MADRQSWYSFERNAAAETVDLILHNEIGAYGITSGEFVTALRAIEDDGAPPLNVRINSPGGSVDDGIAIYNALRDYKGTVTTTNDAMAGSIASVIFQAGANRVMRPHSRVMVHNAMAMGGGVAVGYASDFEAIAVEAQKVAANLRETSANIATIYAERSGKPVDYWQAKMDAESRFTGKAAVDEGLADEVAGGAANVVAFREAATFEFKGYREAALIREEILAIVPERAQETTTIAASLAAAVYDAFTDEVADLIEDQDVTIAEAGNITSLLGPLLTSLEASLGNLGSREIEDDEDMAMPMMARLHRAIERNAGRTVSQANLDRFHSGMDSLLSMHTAVCDMGDGCPLVASTSNKVPPATPSSEDPRAAERRELEAALARVSQEN